MILFISSTVLSIVTVYCLSVLVNGTPRPREFDLSSYSVLLYVIALLFLFIGYFLLLKALTLLF